MTSAAPSCAACPGGKCNVASHKEHKSKAKNNTKKCDGESHHIIPDMVWRLGKRTGMGMNQTKGRIKNAPTLNSGASICLTDKQHNGLHKKLNADLEKLGNKPPPPDGTAPLGEIMKKVRESIQNIPGMEKECADLAVKESMKQIKNRKQPGRTTTSLPSKEADQKMSSLLL